MNLGPHQPLSESKVIHYSELHGKIASLYPFLVEPEYPIVLQ